jgi:triacylglycerol esterase/lipase EstA (alpha/beta hydrolase family)
MSKIVRLFVISLIALLISTPLIAGGHKYIAPPVIFVHGFNADMGSWTTTKSNLQYLYVDKYGYKYNSINPAYFPDMNYGKDKLGVFSKNGDCTVIATKQGDGLSAVIENTRSNYPVDYPDEEKKVIIVAHSFGGLVTRSLLKQYPDYQNKIAKVIFVGTPHAGSPLASALWLLKEADPKALALIEKYKNNVISTGANRSYFRRTAASERNNAKQRGQALNRESD